MKTIKADPVSYSDKTRDRKQIEYIVIHNTGNKGDTAEANAKYFANGNIRSAGAHFFIDQKGNVYKSVNLNRTAWAVGGNKWDDCKKTGGGKLYGVAHNFNSVSIELCDIIDREPSEEMMQAVWRTIKYIRRWCPNAQNIIRHFDVNGKHCPQAMMEQEAWNKFQLRLLSIAMKNP